MRSGHYMKRVISSLKPQISLHVSFFKVRTVGDILLVAAYKENYDNTDVVEWGYILQGLGYTFLLSATLAFYQRAKDPDAAMTPKLSKGIRGILADPSPPKILHLITTIGFILLIIGYTDSDGIFPTSTNGTSTTQTATLDVKAKIGDCIFVFVTIAIAFLTIISIRSAQTTEARRIYQFILLALPFMAARMVYITYESFTKDPFHRTLWVKIVFQFIMEIAVVVIYFVLGFVIDKISSSRDIEAGTGRSPNYDSSFSDTSKFSPAMSKG